MRAVYLSSVLILGGLAPVGASGQAAALGRPATAFGVEMLQAHSMPGPLTWKHRVLTGIGASALGLGLGFFVSQISESDWEEVPGRFQVNRGLWAAVGGGIGFAVGFSFPIRGKAMPRVVRVQSAADRAVIGPAEFLDLMADNAYDIVRALRPEWLNSRPPNVFGDTRQNTVPVYLDEFRYGDLDSMRRIHVQTIRSIRFVPPATATALWGTGHVAGVIQILTVG